MKRAPRTSNALHPSRRGSLELTLSTLALVAALVVGCAGAGSGSSSQATDDIDVEAPTVAVRIAEVRTGPRRERLEVTGLVASKAEVPLAFKIGGVVAELLPQEGERVARGQRLGRLELDEIEGRLDQASVALEQAQRDLERVRGLYRDGAATEEELEKTTTAVRLASSELEIASFNHDYATVHSPVAGWVLDRRAEPGQLVGPGEPVLVVGSSESGWVVRVGLADRDVVRVARGDRATVALAALPSVEIPAQVTQIAETADPTTGTFEVELQLLTAGSEARGRIKSGFVARATLAPEASGTTPTVPVEALVRADGRDGLVYGVEPETGRFWPVPIAIGGFDGDRLVVREGLEEVAWVITDGADRLTRDSRLDIRDRTAGGAPDESPPPAAEAETGATTRPESGP